MRWLAVCTLLGSAMVLGAAPKKSDRPPIAVIKLERTTPVVYEKEIEPIFKAKCTVCHSGNVTEGRYDMGNYTAVMKGGKSGPAVVPNKSADSLLVKMTGGTKKPYMPPVDEENVQPLTPQELALITLWIDQGAKPPSAVTERPKIVLTPPPAHVKPVRATAIALVAKSPDPKKAPDSILVATGRGHHIHLYDGKGEYVRSLIDSTLKTTDGKPVPAAHLSLIESLAFSPDGQTLASGSFQEVILWDLASSTIRQRLTGFADRVVALAFSPDGKLLAAGGGAPTEEGELKVFHVSSGQLAFEVKPSHSDTVFGVCFSPDSTKLASCGADKFVKVWEASSGKFLKNFEGHTHHVLGVGWKADGKLLASGGADSLIKIWDYEKGEQVRTIKDRHTKQVSSLVFCATKPEFLTCGGDRKTLMFNVDNGGTARAFADGGDFLYSAAVTPDGNWVVVGGEDGTARLFNGQSAALVKALLPPSETPMDKPAAPAKK